MLWIKAFHLIFMVTWFSGLFYLPRLFVYHSSATDEISIERFKRMEKKLYFVITTPGGILTLIFGLWLLFLNYHYYMHMPWMHLKLSLVLFLIVYHLYLGKVLVNFAHNQNKHSTLYYRILNELPVIFLISIVILVIVKPF